MNKIKMHISKKSCWERPSKKGLAAFREDTMCAEEEMDMGLFAVEAGENGRAFIPAFYDKEGNFLFQQMFVLNFSSITLDEFLSRAKKYLVYPAFVYSVSDGFRDGAGFCAVFVNDCAVRDLHAAFIITELLRNIFPEADKSCKDGSRLVWGGNRKLYENLGAEINIRDLAVRVQEKFLEKGSTNYSKDVKRLGHRLGVNVKNNILSIHRIPKNQKNYGFWINSIIIIENIQKPYISYIIEIDRETGLSVDKKHLENSMPFLQNKSGRDIAKICPLFQDFYEIDFPDAYKFFLASNLIHVKGGKSLFFNGLLEDHIRWRVEWKYIEAYVHAPQECHDIKCPYKEQCKCRSLYHKLSDNIKRIAAEPVYSPLKEAEIWLERTLEAALYMRTDGINLIKAQTALGKTTAYCRIAQHWHGERPLMIAVPTLKLQDEVYWKLRIQYGVDADRTPSVIGFLDEFGEKELQMEVDWLYERGFGYRVKSTIREYIKRNIDELSYSQILAIEKYKRYIPKLDGSRCVVTTHARLLMLPEVILRKYEIIVDEDILMTIFKNTGSISFQDMEMILRSGIDMPDLKDRVGEMLFMKDGSIDDTGLPELDRQGLERLFKEKLPVSSSIPDFMASSVSYVDVNSEQVHYFKAKKIPGVKLTIVSASLDPKLYDDYCKCRIIRYKEIPPAKYKGELIQYTAYSMSRSCIENIGFEKIQSSIQDITGKNGMRMITFKKFSKCSIYFGKTEGFNDYSGQDLVVLGTPHNVPFNYFLIGRCLGYGTDGNMNLSIAEHNGYSFRIMTFGNLDMRKLQFYFLESELEQAIGRARLLRKECTVYLFSNFPCSQAKIIQDDYIYV